MRALILVTILGASSIAAAQPTTTKPDEATPSTTPSVPAIHVTTKKFGPVKAGKKLTLAAVKKAFPKATITRGKDKASSWFIKGAGDLVAHADATTITVGGGPVEVHGVMIGDDGAELAGGSFAGAYCFAEPKSTDVVICNKDALSLTLTECSAQPEGDSIPLASLAGCKVFEIAWIAYAPPQ